MSYCQQQTLVNTLNDVRSAIALRCRSWNCADCAQNRRNGLIAECIGGAPNKFLTLTFRSDDHSSPDNAARKLAHAWRLLRLRIMRGKPELDRWRAACAKADKAGKPRPAKPDLAKAGKHQKPEPLPFIAVFERTQNGWPHLHILLRARFIKQSWIAREMDALISSPIVWIETVTGTTKLAAYVAKYCGKDPFKFATVKRYWSSKDFDLRQEHEHEAGSRVRAGWIREDLRISTVTLGWLLQGLSVKWLSPFHAVGRPKDTKRAGNDDTPGRARQLPPTGPPPPILSRYAVEAERCRPC